MENKFIRIASAIYNVEHIVSIYKIERNTQGRTHGIRVELKNDTEYMYFNTKKERDNLFEVVSHQLIN